MTPIGEKGALPACAAGTSREAGPGLPVGFEGSAKGFMELTPEAVRAVETANTRAALQASAIHDPAELGIATAQMETK